MKLKKTVLRVSTRMAMAKTGFTAIFACFSAACYTTPIAAESIKTLPKPLQEKVEKLQADLSARGYEVAQGDFHLFTIDDCKYAIQTIGNCLGNNPTAPYVIPTIPHWPDEFVDDHMKNLLGPEADKTGWTYRLGEQDALVVLGLLPPPGRYFGIQSYIFTRDGSANLANPIYESLTDSFMKSILFMASPNPARQLVFSSLGDSINNVTIERQSGAAFDQQRFVVITSGAALGRDLSEALLRAGVPDRRQIFTEPVSPDIARLGLGKSSDEFMTLIRYALPDDEAAGEQWRKQLPITVLRVRSKNVSTQSEPYAMPLRQTRIARSEMDLKGSVDDLVAAVKGKWGQLTATDTPFYSLLLAVDLVGEHCLKLPMNCLGDTGDADYQISETVDIDSGEVLAVVGTLGTLTGNAVYSSISVNRIPELVGAANLTDTDLAGSSSSFASSVSNTEKLYLRYFARDCMNLENCLEVTEQMVPRGNKLKIIQRNYVAPGSARGPDPKMLVNPRLIILKGKSN